MKLSAEAFEAEQRLLQAAAVHAAGCNVEISLSGSSR